LGAPRECFPGPRCGSRRAWLLHGLYASRMAVSRSLLLYKHALDKEPNRSRSVYKLQYLRFDRETGSSRVCPGYRVTYFRHLQYYYSSSCPCSAVVASSSGWRHVMTSSARGDHFSGAENNHRYDRRAVRPWRALPCRCSPSLLTTWSKRPRLVKAWGSRITYNTSGGRA